MKQNPPEHELIGKVIATGELNLSDAAVLHGFASRRQERSVKTALKRHMRMFMNLWPPFLGAGIRVRRLGSGWTEIDVEMKLRWWNRNYVGTHYGGSLYSMTDPFFMLMLIENLGRDYLV